MLTKKSTYIYSDYDLVNFTVENNSIKFSYNTGFQISSALRLAANRVFALNGAGLSERKNIDLALQKEEIPFYATNQQEVYVRSWAVNIVENNLVELVVNNTSLIFDSEIALTFSHWIKKVAKKCKANIGDNSKLWTVSGYLTDAEENYKLNLNRR